jgi:hypothetical protein
MALIWVEFYVGREVLRVVALAEEVRFANGDLGKR